MEIIIKDLFGNEINSVSGRIKPQNQWQAPETDATIGDYSKHLNLQIQKAINLNNKNK
jgi:hypothetical protein